MLPFFLVFRSFKILETYEQFNGRRGIAPIFLKCNKSFCMHKTYFFFITISFLHLIYPLGVYNRNKTGPGDHESNFKNVVAIPCGCNTNWTQFNITKNIAKRCTNIILANLIKWGHSIMYCLLMYFLKKSPISCSIYTRYLQQTYTVSIFLFRLKRWKKI